MTHGLHGDKPDLVTPREIGEGYQMPVSATRLGHSRPRLALVPLSSIHAPEGTELAPENSDAPLDVPADFALLASLLRPPLLVQVDGLPDQYTVVGNLRTLQWQVQVAAASGEPNPKVTAVTLPASVARHASRVPSIQSYLLPLLLGELSTRDVARAKRSLRQSGVSGLRRLGSREQLKPLIGTKPPARNA